MTTREGSRFFVNTASFMEWRIFFYGSYEKPVQELIRRHLRAGSVAIDVGANIGTHTVEMSRVVGEGRVVACEPNPFVFDRLLKNITLNDGANVIACRTALTDEPGPATLYVPASTDADQATARMGPATDRTRASSTLRVDAQAVTVDATTLDHLAARLELERVDLIKVDVEGYEGGVLRGARNVLTSHRPLLIFEYDPRLWGAAGNDLRELLSSLRELGYCEFGVVAGDRSKYTAISSWEEVGATANIVAFGGVAVR